MKKWTQVCSIRQRTITEMNMHTLDQRRNYVFSRAEPVLAVKQQTAFFIHVTFREKNKYLRSRYKPEQLHAHNK